MIKKCPVCKETLQDFTLEEGLPAQKCPSCDGVWVSSNPYLTWLRQHGMDLPEKKILDDDLTSRDIKELKICPDCGHILSPFQVLSSPKLFLDHCGHCNGVWLDKGEWKSLVDRNLHDNLNSFFTRPWQARVQEDNTFGVMDKLYREKFGEADYERVRQFREWLKDNPHRPILLAYLQADNPYKI
jgi:Zn-finger nucleic acid-binding protein